MMSSDVRKMGTIPLSMPSGPALDDNRVYIV